MTKLQTEHTYFKRGHISVTAQYLSTRFKDEALAPIQSVQIGRDPLWMAGIIAVGLLLFANRFGDLLYWYEQCFLVGLGFITAIAGYCIASLQIGQHMRERTVLVSSIWTINAVRKAIAEAKRGNNENMAHTIVLEDVADDITGI